MQPWRLLADPSGYIFTWLLGYSGGLGSIAGVLIADYWPVRGRALALEDLYLASGVYRSRHGWNWRAVAATAVGCALAWGGLVVPLLAPLYSYAWFVGFLAAALVHWSLMRLRHESPEVRPQSGGRAEDGVGGRVDHGLEAVAFGLSASVEHQSGNVSMARRHPRSGRQSEPSQMRLHRLQ